MTTEHYDVIIIGTCAGGGTLAHKLAPSGKRILLLERGGYLAREPELGQLRGLINDRYLSGEVWYDKERVGAYRGGLAGAGDPQRQVLAGPGGRQEASVRRGQVDTRYGGGFGDHFGHAQRPEPSPGRPGTGGRFGAKARGGGAVAFGGQQVAERALPARAEGGGAPWAVIVP